MDNQVSLSHKKPMNTATLRSLTTTFGRLRPQFEHRAVLSIIGLKLAYVEAGYELLKDGSPAFLQRGNDRVELLPDTVPEHTAYAVGSITAWLRLDGQFKRSLDFVEIEGRVTNDDVLIALFRHKETGDVVQIIWRKTQLFHGLFSA